MKPFPYLSKHENVSLEWYGERVYEWIGLCQWPDVLAYVEAGSCTVCAEDMLDSYELGEFGASVMYDLAHGQGSWDRRRAQDLEKHIERAYTHGMEAGRIIADSRGTKAVGYTGPVKFRDSFIEGMQSVMPPDMFAEYAGVDLATNEITQGKDMYSKPRKH